MPFPRYVDKTHLVLNHGDILEVRLEKWHTTHTLRQFRRAAVERQEKISVACLRLIKLQRRNNHSRPLCVSIITHSREHCFHVCTFR